MSNNNFPLPPSHRTFTLGKVIIDSNFDSGNCSFAEKINASTVYSLSRSMPFGSDVTILRIFSDFGSIFQWRGSARALCSTFK